MSLRTPAATTKSLLGCGLWLLVAAGLLGGARPATAAEAVDLPVLAQLLGEVEFSAASRVSERLAPHIARLADDDAKRQREFAAAAQRRLSAKAAERLRGAREAYAAGHGRLLGLLRQMAAPKAGADRKTLAAEAAEIVGKLREAEGSQPLSAETLSVSSPELTAPALGQTSGATSSEPIGSVPAVLRAAAASLADPVAVYEDVRNRIRPDFYYGAMKGAVQAHLENHANDADSASVLVFMLRAKGIPARYVRGTVELRGPRLSALTGTATVEQAVRVLARAGIPHEVVLGAGGVASVRMERIWVEAYIPYSNYRGALLDTQGKTWIPLDPSFKTFSAPAGMDVVGDLGFDPLAFTDEYATALRNQTPLQLAQTRVAEALAQRFPGKTYADVLNPRLVLGEAHGLLPSSLPYKVVQVTETSYDLPAPLQHTIRIMGEGANGTVIDTRLALPEVLGKRLTLSYLPYSDEDAETAASFGGLHRTPPYLVDVKAVVKSSGLAVAVGTSPIGLGVRYDLRLEVASPGGTQVIENKVIAGNLTVIGLGGREVTGQETASDHAAQILSRLAWTYLDRWNDSDEELASLLRVVPVRPTVSVCLVMSALDVDYAGGDPLYPLTFDWKGIAIDADRRSSAPVGVEKIASERSFLLLSGLEGSVLEERLFEDNLQISAIATNEVLALARAQNVTVHELNAGNVDDVLPTLPFAPQVLEDVRDAAYRGLRVTIPAASVTQLAWTGVGYRILDETSGAASYQLQGGHSGGVTTPAVVQMPKEVVDPVARQGEDPEPQADQEVAFIRVFPSTDFQEGTVDKPLPKALKVLVTNDEGFPVKGTPVLFGAVGGGMLLDPVTGERSLAVTVMSDARGEAAVRLVLGRYTSSIPRYALHEGDEYSTQVGLNYVQARAGALTLAEPFTAIAYPDYREVDGGKKVDLEFEKRDSDYWNNLRVAGRLDVDVTDQHGNPISNIPLTYKYTHHDEWPMESPWIRRDPITETKGHVLTPKDFHACMKTFASVRYGECEGEAEEVVVKSSVHGSWAYPVLGDSSLTRYWYQVATEHNPETFEARFTTGGWKCNTATTANCQDEWLLVPKIVALGGTRWFYNSGDEAHHVGGAAPMSFWEEVLWEEDEVIETTDSDGNKKYRVQGTNKWHRDPLGGAEITLIPVTPGTKVSPEMAVEVDAGLYQSTVEIARTPQVNKVRTEVKVYPDVVPYIRRDDGTPTPYVKAESVSRDNTVIRVRSSEPWTGGGGFGLWGIEPRINTIEPLPFVLDDDGRLKSPSVAKYEVLPPEFAAKLDSTEIRFDLLRNGDIAFASFHPTEAVIQAGTRLEEDRYEARLVVVGVGYEGKDIQSEPTTLQDDLDACSLLTLKTRQVDLSIVADPEGGDSCATGATIVFRLCRPGRVTVRVGGSILTASIDDSDRIELKDLQLGVGRHRIRLGPDQVDMGAASGENGVPFDIKAVDVETGRTEEAAGVVRASVHNRPVTPIGRTFVKGVDLFDGHLVHQQTDLKVPGRHLGLQMTRTYSSSGRSGEGVMGAGWSWTYGSSLQGPSCGKFTVTTADGNGAVFYQDGTGFRPQKGYHVALRRTPADGGFDFIDKAGNVHHFSGPLHPRDTLPRRLEYIEEPHGDRIVLTYDARGRVSKVAEVQAGAGEVRFLKVSYEEFGGHERITQVASGTLALQADYKYDEHGNLTEARVSGSNVLGPRAEDRVYTYDYTVTNDRDLHQMAGYSGPNRERVDYLYYPRDADFPRPGQTIILDRDEYMREVRERDDKGGVATRFAYDFTGMVGEPAARRMETAVTDGRDELTRYVLNLNGSPLEIHEPMDKTTFMEWDLDERVKKYEKDTLGRETHYTHDRGNLKTERIEAKGVLPGSQTLTSVITSYDYDPRSSKLTSKRDPDGRTTVYDIDEVTGDLLSVTDGAGNVTEYKYDAQGRLTTTISPRKYETIHSNHDSFGNWRTARDPEGITTTRTFDARGRLVEEKDTLGRRRRLTYDGLDRVTVQQRDAGGSSEPEVTRTAYYAGGEPREVTEPGGATTTFTIDALNRVTATTTNTRYEMLTTSADYDKNGNKIAETDRRGVQRRFTYNDLNQLEKVEIVGGPGGGPTGTITTYDRDLLGNVETETDFAGRTTRYEVDGLYRVARKHLPEAPYFEEYTYDLAGNKKVVKDANGHTTSWDYDGLSRVIETRNALGHAVKATYNDPEGSHVNKSEEHDVVRGLRTTFTYDRSNRERTRTVHLEGAGGQGQKYTTETVYEAGHSHRVIDPNGGVARFVLDGLDRVVQKSVVVDGESLTTRTVYNGLGQPKEVVDPRGHLTSFTYDGLGRLRATRDAEGHTSTVDVDGGGLKIGETDRRGIRKVMSYDNLGRPLRTSIAGSKSGVGWSHTIDYQDSARKRIERDARNHPTTYELDALERPLRIFDGVHATPVVLTYDGVNKRSETDRRGHKTTFDYDALNRPTTATDPAPFSSQTVVTSYNDAGNSRSVKDKRGNVTVTQMDPLGRVITVTRANVTLERNTYDGNGNKTLAIDAEGRQTKFDKYDAANRLRVRIDGFGSADAAVTSFTYDKSGNVTTERDGRAASLGLPWSVQRTYDPLNRLHTETNAENETTTYGYDEEGNRTSVQEPLGKTTSYSYDELGKLFSVTQPGNLITRYTYDPNRNRLTQTDAKGQVVEMQYDLLNRLELFKQDPSGLNLVTEHRYDANGNETLLIDPKKQTVESEYDELNRLKSKTYGFAPGDTVRPWRHTTSVGYTYDENNNIRQADETVASGTDPPSTAVLTTTRSYDNFDRILSETTTLPEGGGTRTVGYTYHDDGARETVTADGQTTTYAYDGRARLKTATTFDNKVSRYTYLADGLTHTVEYPNGVVATHGYDKADRLTSLVNAKGAAVVSRYDYTYDDNGNRLTQDETLGGTTERTTYTYDDLNRLWTVTYPADAAFPAGRYVEYGYDAVGNRETEVTKHPTAGTVFSSKTGSFDRLNRLRTLVDSDPSKTIAFTYDDNGNQTSKTVGNPAEPTTLVRTDFFYDIRDKLVEAKRGTSIDVQYQHDFEGRLIRSFDDQGVKQYAYDQTSRLVEYTTLGGVVARYDYGSDRLIRLAHQTEGQRFYHFDALGSVTALTDPLGTTTASYHLDAWGVFRQPAETTASQNRFAFTGYVFSPLLNLYYAKARFYDPEVGRFTSQDSFLGKIDEPPSLHRYFYANASPTRYVDRDGRVAQWIWGAGVGATVGFGLNAARQGIAIYEGAQDGWEWGQFFKAGGTGAVIGAVAVTNPVAAARMGMALSAYGAATGAQEIKEGHPLTGSFDLATSLLGARASAKVMSSGKPLVAAEGRTGTAIRPAMADGPPSLAGPFEIPNTTTTTTLPPGSSRSVTTTTLPEGVTVGGAAGDGGAAISTTVGRTNVSISLQLGTGSPSVTFSMQTPPQAPSGATYRDAAGRLRTADGRFAKNPNKAGSSAPATAYDRDSIVRGPYRGNQPKVLQRDPTCQYCQVNPSTTADHVVSAYEGDALVGAGILSREEAVTLINDLSNLLGACPSCNSGKGASLPGNTPGTWTPSNPSPEAIAMMRKLGTWKD